MANILEKIFGSYSERELKRIMPIVESIEAMEPEIRALTDAQLRAKTDEFKERLANGETLDDILPEAFAVVREAADRVIGERHFKVQLMGGIILHQGRIAEMKTGEGKTLVATLPSYLNALEGKGVHVVTVNDYLANISRAMGRFIAFSGFRLVLLFMAWIIMPGAMPTIAISPMEPTTSLDLTTSVTTWWFTRKTWYSAICIMPLWTR